MSVTYTRRRVFSGFDGVTCKVFPGYMTDGEIGVLFWDKLLLSGSDVFVASYSAVSTDGGTTFGEPRLLSGLDGRSPEGYRTHLSNFCPFYSKSRGKWLLFANRTYYKNDKEPVLVSTDRRYYLSKCDPFVAEFDPATGAVCGAFRPVPVPWADCLCAMIHGQPIEEENGDLTLTYYVSTAAHLAAAVYCVRYAMDGAGEMSVVSASDSIPGEGHGRGLCEPSLARLSGKSYLTIRTDTCPYLAVSEDGLHFSELIPWSYDDGTPLQSFNTMQRWVRFADRLYLVYTRVDRLNGHVFRNRAPLYMAPFDPERLCLIRSEEIILVPELGARLGNFTVTDLSPREALVITAEWMQPATAIQYGSDNSVWLVKVTADA